MNYAVEEIKNIGRYYFSFMQATKCRIHKKYNVYNLLCILQDSVYLSVGWCACSVSLLSPGQHCFLHSAAL